MDFRAGSRNSRYFTLNEVSSTYQTRRTRSAMDDTREVKQQSAVDEGPWLSHRPASHSLVRKDILRVKVPRELFRDEQPLEESPGTPKKRKKRASSGKPSKKRKVSSSVARRPQTTLAIRENRSHSALPALPKEGDNYNLETEFSKMLDDDDYSGTIEQNDGALWRTPSENIITSMPLDLFDNIEYDPHSPEEWLSKRKDNDPGVLAKSKYFSPSGSYSWEPCYVIGYDNVSKMFIIQWKESGFRKNVRRFNIIFHEENLEVFDKRLKEAETLRSQSEKEIKTEIYIQNMNIAELNLQEATFERILEMSAQSATKQNLHVLDNFLLDLKNSFNQANKRSVFIHKANNPAFKEKINSLGLMLPEHETTVPPKGVIDISGYNIEKFNKISKLVTKRMLIAQMPMLKTLQFVQNIWKTFNEACFFNLSTNSSEHYDITEWNLYQERSRKWLIHQLNEEWVKVLHSSFIEYVSDHDVAYNQQTDHVGKNNIHRFVELVSFLMSGQLRDLVLDSSEIYLNFLESFSYAAQDSSNSLPNFDERLLPSQNSLFSLSIVIERDKAVFVPRLKEVKMLFEELFINLLKETHFTIPTIASAANVLKNSSEPTTYLRGLDPQDQEAQDLKDNIYSAIEDRISEVLVLQEQFQQFSFLLEQDYDQFQITMSKRDLRDKSTLDEFRVSVQQLLNDASRIQFTLPNEVLFKMFIVDCKQAKMVLINRANNFAKMLLAIANDQVSQEDRRISGQFEDIYEKAQKRPETPEEMVELKEFFRSQKKNLLQLDSDISQVKKIFQVLHDFSFSIPKDSFKLHQKTLQWPSKIYRVLDKNEEQLAEESQAFQEQLVDQRESLARDLDTYIEEVDAFHEYSDMENADTIAEQVLKLQQKIESAEATATLCQQREKIFNWKKTNYRQFGTIRKKFVPYSELWTTVSEWKKKLPHYTDGLFVDIDPKEVQTNVQTWFTTMVKSMKIFKAEPKPLAVATKMKAEIEGFKKHVPLVTYLRNPGMRDRHWKQLANATQFPLDHKDTITLSEMLDLGIEQYLELIKDISEHASKEHHIELKLDGMQDEWKSVTFVIEEYGDKGAFILKDVEQILNLIDDHIIKTQSIRSSPYIKQFESHAKGWEQQLVRMQELLSSWLLCQRNWIYLEPVFSSNDISKQLSVEATRFETIDKMWLRVMSNVARNPSVITVCSDPELKKNFDQANRYMDDILKSLNNYLETKRAAFPRFYFLSNEELLEIVSETKNPLRVQKHLNKIFDNIEELSFENNMDITAMSSPDGEKVPFNKIVNPEAYDNKVETWLREVENTMVSTLRELLEKAVQAYRKTSREKWLLQPRWPGQIILVTCQLYWTQEVSRALISSGLRGLQKYGKKLNTQMTSLIDLVRKKQNPIQSSTLSALIVIEVHARDVVSKLIEEGVTDVSDFAFLRELRYYWDENEKELLVKMMHTTVRYNYEYLGNTSRLVVTPLTEKCYRTMMAALQMNLGGAPEGPAGTGKTETVKDLAKAVAKKCVVFNCSEGLDYKAMGRFFKGLAASGAWSCFDEFNRIELDVLSVVAQQIWTIQQAIVARLSTFTFEGDLVPLNPTCAVFITMNPGYAGRSELPDNLKALFRPCAMMIPDYALIAEISLFSYGFHNGRALAKKLTATYRLCSEQLSTQDHYDYGMRAVKAVLLMARKLKQDNPELSEDLIMLRAITGANLPKFIQEDVPLFENIIADLFPDSKMPDPNFEYLIEALHRSCKQMNLEPTENFIQKCLQLFQITDVRHGNMLVGETMSGKTSVYRTLSTALSSLARQNIPGYYAVQTKTINPKSINIQQLYGFQDSTSNEWKEGVLSSIFREYAFDKSNIKKWIILDGPVDASWIENMNTVLDDNKKLCLTSGETIQMSNNMTLIFEVEDLAVASPATVSRCGMVFTEASQLGWTPLVHSWCNTIPDGLRPYVPRIKSLFEYVVPLCIEFIQKNGEQTLKMTYHWMVSSLLRLYESCLLSADITPENANGGTSPSKSNSQGTINIVDCLFIFSVAWSLGGSLNPEGRERFNDFFKAHLTKRLPTFVSNNGGQMQIPIPSGSIFDYYFDAANGAWNNWQQQVGNFSIPEDADLHDVFVPTADSCRYSFLLENFAEQGHSVLLCGPTGTGKTKLVKNYLTSQEINVYPMLLHFSGRTQAQHTQAIIDSKLQKRRLGVFGPPLGKKGILFIDDMNMPMPEEYGAQPPIELLRQFMDHGGWYDFKGELKQIIFRHIQDVQLIAAMQPTYGQTQITYRMLRHFGLINVEEANDRTLFSIFSTILGSFLKHNVPTLASLNKTIVEATVEMYRAIASEMRPVPAKSHYMFNLRDISKVIQGMASVVPEYLRSKEHLIRLWYHESSRVFCDRLVNEVDIQWFTSKVQDIFEYHFAASLEQIVVDRALLFANFAEGPVQKSYQEISLKEAQQVIEGVLDELQDRDHSTNIVLFQFAIEHISRISRIIHQPFGNALLVGVGGSGRQTLTRLAAHMALFELYEFDSGTLSNIDSWREELKKVFMKAGCDNREIVLLLSDNKIGADTIYEDINNILNVGEVPDIFNTEDMNYILDAIRGPAKLSGVNTETNSELYRFFVTQCRRNLHLVLCISPLGSNFRTKVRAYPSLVNCCTIDWFLKWPSEALESVAGRTIQTLSIPNEAKSCLAKLCVEFHLDVQTLANQYSQEMRRTVHITPSSFLQLLDSFKFILGTKEEQISKVKQKYEQGLRSLKETETVVEHLRQQQQEEQPILLQTRKQTEQLMEKLKADQKEADLTKIELKHQENDARERAENAQAMRDDCEKDLSRAMPALNEAIDAVESLNPRILSEMKKMPSPPEGVRLVMEAVCIMLEEEPAEVRDGMGGISKDYWITSQKLLASNDFVKRLVKYKRDKIPPQVIEKIRPYLAKSKFDPKKVKRISSAAGSLCRWVWAMEKYYRANLVVIPKKQKLTEAEEQLAHTQEMLNEMRKKLEAEERRIQELLATLSEAENKKKALEDSLELCSVRLHRAQRLLDALTDEKTRWKNIVEKMINDEKNMIGDSLLSAAFITYLSPFDQKFRQKYNKKWHQSVQSSGSIDSSDDFSFVETLSSSLEILKWRMQGLPADKFSVENAVIICNTNKWPLIIDPQGQASTWIKNREKENTITTIKPSDTDFVRSLEKSIDLGQPVLLENLGEELDPAIEPLIRKEIEKNSQGELSIKLGGKEIVYSSDFTLYLTTNLPRPEYAPDVSTNVTLVNFTITLEGLSEQLLSLVVEREEKKLEDQRIQIIKDNARNSEELERIENKMLAILSGSESGQSLLDREDLIEALDESKRTARDISNKVELAKATEANIEKARNQYRRFSELSAELFFVTVSLAYINPMYAFGIEWFIALFIKALEQSPRAASIQQRIDNLTTEFFSLFYANVCRSIFEKDKLLLSFMMSIKTAKQPISYDEWRLFLTGSFQSSISEDNPTNWLPEINWRNIVAIGQLPKLEGLIQNIRTEPRRWEALFKAESPQDLSIPGKWDSILSNFQKLLLRKALRPDKLSYCLRNFVSQELGQTFIEPPHFDLQAVFDDSWCTTPILFILTPGSDPKSSIKKLADKRAMNLVQVSLGSGQGEIASREIRDLSKRGGWVLLENCHLSEAGYLANLARIVDSMDPNSTHIDFRLWLTTNSTPDFPVSILQKSIKVTNEPPQGVKANLLRSFTSHPISDADFFDSCADNSLEWRNLMFGLAFFHAIVQERRSYGPLGWNIPYEFSDEDLAISLRNVRMLIEKNHHIPFEALTYTIGELNYGGRVTDEWDQRTLRSILSDILCEELVVVRHFKFSESGGYYVPDVEFYDDYLEHIKTLPEQKPDLFGLGLNANVSKDKKEANQIMETLLATEAGRSAESISTKDQTILQLVNSILKALPDTFDISEAKRRYPPESYKESMNAVLIQELKRFNKLLSVIKSSLQDCSKAIKGLIVMSPEIESLSESVFQGQVPKLWLNVSYPSVKPLQSYIADLKKRIKFFSNWIYNGQPFVFWMPGFFFIKSFLTGVLQNYARKYSIPIDKIHFEFEFYETLPSQPPKEGAYVQGLFLEGASWNRQSHTIDEPKLNESFTPLPVVWLKPTDISNNTEKMVYQCPVYVTPERRGILSTTGQSTNYVLAVDLPISATQPESLWIKRGTALLCQLDI